MCHEIHITVPSTESNVLNPLLLHIVVILHTILTESNNFFQTQHHEHWEILVFSLAAHVETSIVAHLENASSQTEESKIAANFQTVYAKQFLLHKLCPNINEQSRPGRTETSVRSSIFRNNSVFIKVLFLSAKIYLWCKCSSLIFLLPKMAKNVILWHKGLELYLP